MPEVHHSHSLQCPDRGTRQVAQNILPLTRSRSSDLVFAACGLAHAEYISLAQGNAGSGTDRFRSDHTVLPLEIK